jgi:hypothetical protein
LLDALDRALATAAPSVVGALADGVALALDELPLEQPTK